MRAVLIPILFALAGIGAGVSAGLFLKPSEPAANEDADNENADTEGDPDPVTEKTPDETEFARLNNQFIVPVVAGDSVEAMVVLSLTLEVTPGGTETVFENEPRLRDSFLRVLFDHANIGGFDSGFTRTGAMNLLRRALREAAAETLGPVLQDVLIVDIVRQEV